MFYFVYEWQEIYHFVLLIILFLVGVLMNPIIYYYTVTLNSTFAVLPKTVQLVDTYAFEMKNILLSSDKKYDDENNENINKKVVDDNNELLAKNGNKTPYL